MRKKACPDLRNSGTVSKKAEVSSDKRRGEENLRLYLKEDLKRQSGQRRWAWVGLGCEGRPSAWLRLKVIKSGFSD